MKSVIVVCEVGQERPFTGAEQANGAAKQRKRGIVVVKLPILLSYCPSDKGTFEKSRFALRRSNQAKVEFVIIIKLRVRTIKVML